MKKIVLFLITALLLCFLLPTTALADAGVDAITSADHAPGSGSANSPATPADGLADPLSDPGAAIDDVKAAKRLGWPALVFAIVTIGARVTGRLGKKIKSLAWLAKGKHALIVGACAALGAAGYNAAAAGGAWLATLTAAVMAAFAYWDAAGDVADDASDA